jgi:hypothetical protein
MSVDSDMPHSNSTDGLVTSTLVAITKIGDYLATIEEGSATAKEDGLAQINEIFGKSLTAETFSQAIRTRFDNDLARAFRYSAVIPLYTTFSNLAAAYLKRITRLGMVAHPDARINALALLTASDTPLKTILGL